MTPRPEIRSFFGEATKTVPNLVWDPHTWPAVVPGRQAR